MTIIFDLITSYDPKLYKFLKCIVDKIKKYYHAICQYRIPENIDSYFNLDSSKILDLLKPYGFKSITSASDYLKQYSIKDNDKSDIIAIRRILNALDKKTIFIPCVLMLKNIYLVFYIFLEL